MHWNNAFSILTHSIIKNRTRKLLNTFKKHSITGEGLLWYNCRKRLPKLQTHSMYPLMWGLRRRTRRKHLGANEVDETESVAKVDLNSSSKLGKIKRGSHSSQSPLSSPSLSASGTSLNSVASEGFAAAAVAKASTKRLGASNRQGFRV
jgi:hypothetical protein